MWALVESGSITATYNQPKAIQIGDIKYPSNIFEVWSKSELEAVGLYEVVYDYTNFKDKEYFEDYARVFVGEYDYIFYIDPIGTTMEDNGIRETDLEYRERIDAAVIKAMNTYGHRCKNVHVIKGTTSERIEQILDLVKF